MSIKNLSDTGTNDNENLPNFKYRDVSYFSNLDHKLKLKCISFLHLSFDSLSKYFDNFNHLINDLNLNIDLLDIFESRIVKVQPSKTNKSLQNYLI